MSSKFLLRVGPGARHPEPMDCRKLHRIMCNQDMSSLPSCSEVQPGYQMQLQSCKGDSGQDKLGAASRRPRAVEQGALGSHLGTSGCHGPEETDGEWVRTPAGESEVGAMLYSQVLGSTFRSKGHPQARERQKLRCPGNLGLSNWYPWGPLLLITSHAAKWAGPSFSFLQGVSEEVTETIPPLTAGGRGIGAGFLDSNVELCIERLVIWPILGIDPSDRIMCTVGIWLQWLELLQRWEFNPWPSAGG